MDETENKPKRKRVDTGFGRRLRMLMSQRGLTHRQVSAMIDCNISVVNDWLSGSQPHDIQRVALLATRLGVSLEWLLVGTEGKQPVLTLGDLFDEVPAPELSGTFIISVKRLVSKKK